MIDIKSLRIGSWILLDTRVTLPELHQIKAKDIYDIAEGKVTLDALDGIPLTEEILGACRFAQTFSSDPQIRPASKKYELNGLILHQHNEDIDKFYFYCEDIVLEVSTLHQLMNLYYSLTGKEIEYKPAK